ncbi:translational GTPase TypA [candidate division WWE3 bacterium CG_4_10_14_0_2_um_filter_42_7]|uniref:50S ribosomal subunit assembly factor BipA n=2 Tax=Katanobacteria TaxID=422282 RepID=A0A2H0X9X2_UNCKA|nr:MAG: translational GTPase TypA [candidate division WWE3 bacterium CG08_land_8_20_14_0_20_41_15]PIZ44266.1 MAG: translational GTPase TypA [candidate division WWE3 bacterium CG_4_10_14_0_2_um_filter_42_7]
MAKENIRNVAVIAHVDHGKTTLIDALLKQTHVFRDNEKEMSEQCILDSSDLEREKGITILAKNCTVFYKGIKINIIDTPGHADFSGEVERTLGMADGALLIIDAQEGPMPQTRFVLKKALELGLKIIVVINKIDKQFADVDRAISKTSDLFLDIATDETQIDFPVLYAVGRAGAVYNEVPSDLNEPQNALQLLDKIIDYVPAPKGESSGLFKMVVSSLDHDIHLGQIILGKIYSGTISEGQEVILAQKPETKLKIERVMVNSGLTRIKTEKAEAGDIVALSGIQEVEIGMTLTDPKEPSPLPAPKISEPTLHMSLGPNTSPFSGKEGQFCTARQLEERLNRELKKNLSLRVEKMDNNKFKISGRGELHLAILLETMRREGYEMEVGKPEVIVKNIDGADSEPVEEVDIIVPEMHVGTINRELGARGGSLIKMSPLTETEMEFIYEIPTRALIGLRSLLLTQTKGTVVFNSIVTGYAPLGKPLQKLRQGALVSAETGPALSYGLENAQGRGITFVDPGIQVYEGMIIGLGAKENDIDINVCKGKHLTNIRAASADKMIQLAPSTILSLEQSLDFLENDELLEITPKSLRLRKKFLTDLDRRRAKRAG